jgi:hypothetical protein
MKPTMIVWDLETVPDEVGYGLQVPDDDARFHAKKRTTLLDA